MPPLHDGQMKSRYAGLLLVIFLAGAPCVAWAGDAAAPNDSCADTDKPDGVGQIGSQPDAFYRCTTTGVTRKWIPQSVVVGQTPTTCDANSVGRIYWDSASTSLKVCNGSSGVAIGSSSSVVLGSTATAANPQRSGDASTGLFSPAANTVAVTTAGSEALRITATNSVGIGTTDPVSGLELARVTTPGGTLTLSNSDTNVTTGQYIGNLQFYSNDDSSGGVGVGARIRAIAEDNGVAYGLTFDTRNGSSSLSSVVRITSDGNVGIGTSSPAAVFVVSPPGTETIAAAAVITADACGTIKRVTAGGAVTTNTTNTFTSPTASYTGCCMDVINVGTTNTITLDANTKFKTVGGANISLGPDDAVRVCSNGTNWYQINPVSANQ